MWIRSQDKKKLSDCVEFYLQENKKNRYLVFGCSKNSIGHIIGTYENFEKAKKVLDIIQQQINICVEQKQIIRPATINAFEPYESKSHIVFVMPQDNEVE